MARKAFAPPQIKRECRSNISKKRSSRGSRALNQPNMSQPIHATAVADCRVIAGFTKGDFIETDLSRLTGFKREQRPLCSLAGNSFYQHVYSALGALVARQP